MSRITSRVRNALASWLCAIYLHSSWWTQLIREEVGAAGDVKQQYGSSVAMTITLASLSSSSTWTAGREGTAIATSGTVVDYLIGGKITTGTSPTISTVINVYVYAAVNDTPLYPDVLDGTDSDETITSENVRNTAVVLACSIIVDNTTDRTYWMRPVSLASLFGGVIPAHWGVFVAHNTGVNLNSTGSNHALYYTPVYFNVAQS